MNNEDKDNFYKNFCIFLVIYFAIWTILLPLMDIYLFNDAIGIFMCDNGFVLPIDKVQDTCEGLKK